MNRKSKSLPIPVQRALIRLGRDIRNARLRRRIQAQTMAERASITHVTLHKIEQGDLGVSMGNYATVLFVLGMLARLADVADAAHDGVGLALEEEILPQRIRHRARSGVES